MKNEVLSGKNISNRPSFKEDRMTNIIFEVIILIDTREKNTAVTTNNCFHVCFLF